MKTLQEKLEDIVWDGLYWAFNKEGEELNEYDVVVTVEETTNEKE